MAKPSLWYRPVYYFNDVCESRLDDKLTREDIIESLSTNLHKQSQKARDSVSAGFPWTIARTLFYIIFIPLSVCAMGDCCNASPRIAIGSVVILGTFVHLVNLYWLSVVQSDILSIVEGI